MKDEESNKGLYIRKIEEEELSAEIAYLIDEAMDSLESSIVSLGTKIQDIH